MNKMLFGLAAGVACLVGLATAGNANADGHRARVVTARPYYQTHGVRYGSSYYFAGRDHHQWGHRSWDARYRRYQYWEPNLRIYFYYDAGHGGYYPCN